MRESLRPQCVLLSLALLLHSAASRAQPLEDPELSLAYGGGDFVTIATGARQPLQQAPAVASVITANDIRALGARDIDEVLETVPGLHVSRSALRGNPIYTFRGVHSLYNPQVLLLVNGLPMTSVFVGDRGNNWGGMPVDNIDRIEVIRGPGSALYGADAFAGIINVITRAPEASRNTETGIRLGSHDTYDAWLRHNGALGSARVALYLGWNSTAGSDERISRDAQSFIDDQLGTQASRAPGALAQQARGFDAALDAVLGGWQLRSSYKKREALGAYAGVAQALDPSDDNSAERITADLGWHSDRLAQDWDLRLQANYLHLTDFSELELFPDGAFGGSFPDGVRGNPDKWERHAGLEASAFYTGFDAHRLRLGLGYQKLDLYRTREEKNYDVVFVPGLGNVSVPLGETQEVDSDEIFLTPHSRTVRYAYLQDEWRLMRDWTLTAGVRHDRYSDFGSTTNPRLALVWEAAYDLSVKLLYGEAFRAPSFVELYNRNNPVALGNSRVQPERIRSSEAALTWTPSERGQLSVNFFSYQIRDVLRFVTGEDPAEGAIATNRGRVDGKGAELEASWRTSAALRLSGSYAYQYSEDPETGRAPGNAPRQLGRLRADWQVDGVWSVTPRLEWVADRNREAGDGRPPVADYLLAHLSVHTRGRKGDWSTSLTIRNLFDADAREPSPAPGMVEDDFPLPGRSFVLQGVYRF